MFKKILLLAITAVLMTSWLIPSPMNVVNAEPLQREYGVDLAYRRRVVSTAHTDDNFNTRAVDGSASTRYAAQAQNNAFFYVDLGNIEKIGKVVIDWEAAYASQYLIQLSNDCVTWTTVATVTNTARTIDTIEFPTWIEARYVRFQGVTRATSYGYSFYSFEVYGPKPLSIGAEVLTASSNENATVLNKNNIFDLSASSRWASLQSAGDNQYLIIDLNDTLSFDALKIRWEVSFARRYEIFVHDSTVGEAPARGDSGWVSIVKQEAGLGEVEDFHLPQNISSRYLKVELIQRETSENTKKTGRLPWQSTFSIYSFELFDWSAIPSVPLGNIKEFSKNSPAWVAMSNITLNPTGLLLAPIGYPIEADGKVTNLASIASGNIPGFESYAVYNPAVIYDTERAMFHMIYRSELPDNFANYFGNKYELGHMSTLSYAYSYDGVNFVRGLDNPIAWPTTNDERGGGLEDPRMFKIENDPNRGGLTTYYITYTMYDNNITREGIIYTHDFVTFHKEGRLAPNYGGAHKSGTYVTDPEGNAVLINDPRPGKTGKVYMIYMKDGSYTRIGFTKDVLRIEAADFVDIDTGGFGNNSIEALTKGNESCMAITNIYGPDDETIYLMYGGGTLSNNNIQYQQPGVNGWFYALGVLKTTKSNPFELTNVRLDLDEPTMYPMDTTKIDYGLFDKCMFADSMICHDNKWYLYYGAGDMYVGLATARADFSAGAATFEKTGDVLTASMIALHKSYGLDKSPRSIELVIVLRDHQGNVLETVIASYVIPHFSQLAGGVYSKGVPITASLDLSSIANLPSDYVVTAYVRDAGSVETINQMAHYVTVTPVITKTVK